MQEQLKAHQQVQQVRLQQEQRLLGTEQTTAGAFLTDLYIGVNYCNLLSVCFNQHTTFSMCCLSLERGMWNQEQSVAELNTEHDYNDQDYEDSLHSMTEDQTVFRNECDPEPQDRYISKRT